LRSGSREARSLASSLAQDLRRRSEPWQVGPARGWADRPELPDRCQSVWFVIASDACVEGADVGRPGLFAEQAHLADFLIPRRGSWRSVGRSSQNVTETV
jgi:hypothetical protein